MSELFKAQQHLLDTLGIEWRGKNIASVQLDIRPDKIPTLTVVSHVMSDAPLTITASYAFVPVAKPPAPFDLDAMCAAANARIKRHVDDIANPLIYVHKRMAELYDLTDLYYQCYVFKASMHRFEEVVHAANEARRKCLTDLSAGTHQAGATA